MKKKQEGLLTIQEKTALAVIVVFHLAGLILLNWSSGILYALTIDFVPINLILTTLLVVKFQMEYSSRFWAFCGFAFICGFLVEMAGVNTGLIFGPYSYGEVLGPGLFGTPYIIGLNWFLLSYCALCLLDLFSWANWLKFLLACGLMVGLDYLIEPVAIRLHFWAWEDNMIPVQNYLGWAILSAIIFTQPFLYSFKRKNRVAAIAFIVQVLFFLFQNII